MDQVYASGNVNSAVVVDPKAGITSEQLKDFVDNGPKNELYLSHGQSVVFSLNQAAQIGLKGVNGNATYRVSTQVLLMKMVTQYLQQICSIEFQQEIQSQLQTQETLSFPSPRSKHLIQRMQRKSSLLSQRKL